MRDPKLDFVRQGPGLLPVVLLLAGVWLAVDAGLDARHLGRQQEELDAQIRFMQQRAERLAERGKQSEPSLNAEQDKVLRQAAAALGVDWEALYRHIDKATREDVALLAIVPSEAGRSVQITGEARNLGAVLSFVEALRRPPVTRAILLSHKTKTDDAQRPVVFEINATWNPSL